MAKLISHKIQAVETAEAIVEKVRLRISKSPDSDLKLKYLDELSKGELGRFLLKNRGLNGYWADVALCKAPPPPLEPIESFFIKESPVMIAKRDRFKNLQSLIQEQVKEDCVLASVPCGVMLDLLDLDFSHISSFKLVGMDLDPESLKLARSLADSRDLTGHLETRLEDAWDLDSEQELDVISCAGLIMYESRDERVLELFGRFHRALKSGGMVLASSLSFPPGAASGSPEETWDWSQIDKKAMEKQKMLMEIVEAKWVSYRGSKELKKLLTHAGFHSVRVVFDRARLIALAVASK